MSDNKNILFRDWREERLRDPGFRAAVERLEPAYQVARLRMLRGLTQEELARRVGTSQPSIARLEAGTSQPRLSFLRRVVDALGGRLEVRIELAEETAVEDQSAPVFLTARLEAALATAGGESKTIEIPPSAGECGVPLSCDVTLGKG